MWGPPRRVAVTLTRQTPAFEALFLGIDPQGRLRISTPPAGPRAYAAAEVTLLRELD
jgi:hypothetical protein